MAKRTKSRAADDAADDVPGAGVGGWAAEAPGFGPATTGRFIVIFKDGANDPKRARAALKDLAGLTDMAATSDYDGGAIASAQLADDGTILFELSGIARVSEEAVQSLAASVASDSDSPILSIEPELIAYPAVVLGSPAFAPTSPLPFPFPGFPVTGVPGFPPAPFATPGDYLRGFAEAVAFLALRLGGAGLAQPVLGGGLVSPFGGGEAEAAAGSGFVDTAQFTWGLQATGAHTSTFTGQGVKVAVLDTGFDVGHPDFAGRGVTTATFSGVPVQDHPMGHGTHCVGTALGPKSPVTGVRRYGVAPMAQVFVGRVFDALPQPGASTSNVVAGIDWARTNGCQIVSLSLAGNVNAQTLQYATPIRLALDANCLIIAATGNNGNRPGFSGFVANNPLLPPSLGFVAAPANAKEALAVGGVDGQLRLYARTPRSSALTGIGGIVNLVGPGFNVFSSMPGGHGVMSGTSMATPHVAGLAALWCQASGKRGRDLWNLLVQNVLPLSAASSDVGAGLLRAP